MKQIVAKRERQQLTCYKAQYLASICDRWVHEAVVHHHIPEAPTLACSLAKTEIKCFHESLPNFFFLSL